MEKRLKKHRFDSIKEAVEYIQEKDGCHLFKGSIDGNYGYGIFKVNEVTYRAHRASYEFHHGKIPSDKIICHKCNVKLCINPKHLYAGTKKDNARDRMHDLREKEAKGICEINPELLESAKDLLCKIDKLETKKFTMIFPQSLYDQLKIVCVLTRKSMSDFIRIAILDKVKQLNIRKN